jgi:hypothetical protein
MTPEELPVLVYPEAPVAQIALDTTGQTIFAISASGITVLKLPDAIDNMPSNPWGMALRSGASADGSSVGLAARMAKMYTPRTHSNNKVSRP